MREKVTNGALRPYDMSSGAYRGSFRLAITLCGESGLFFAAPKLLCNYPRRVLEGIPEDGEKGGDEVVGANHASSSPLSSDPCLPQGRSRRIYDLTVLRRVGETVLRNVDKKISPARYLCMRNISRTYEHTTIKQQSSSETRCI